ncbi:MAG: hypothetical protein ACRD1Z_20235 [Vicinamibacteria bacterium]
MSEVKIPKAKVDKLGRIVCPTCGGAIPVPPDRYMGRGPGQCPVGHAFIVDDDAAFAVNDILSRQRGENWRKDVLKNFEETPKEVKPPEEKGQIIFPGPDPEKKP